MKQKRYRICAGLAAALMVLASCGRPSEGSSAASGTSASGDGADGAVNIILFDDSIGVEGEGASAQDGVLTITQPGDYRLSGSLSDGRIVVDAPGEGDVRLILNNVSIHCMDNPPLEVKQAGRVVVELPDGSKNRLTDGGAYTSAEGEGAPDAVLYSNGALVLGGTGLLRVNAVYGHGISADELTVEGGEITVITGGGAGAAPEGGYEGEDNCKGLTADTLLTVTGGNLTADTLDDALHSNGDCRILGGSLSIATGGDALHADYSLTVADGTVNISQSVEGVEGAAIEINGGSVSVVASDDGVNAAHDDESVEKYIRVTGGSLTVDAGGDGIDSNGNLYFEGGDVVVHGPASGGDAALDFDGESVVTGGTLIAAGFADMAVAPQGSESQNVLSLALDERYPAGTLFKLNDAEGNEVLSVTTVREVSHLVLSAPELKQGETYTLYKGEEKLLEVTVDGALTSVGDRRMPGFGGPGRGPGGMPGGRGERPEGIPEPPEGMPVPPDNAASTSEQAASRQ